MQAVILSIHLLLALALIIVVLLQRSEGGGLGIGGGGGVMTSRGAATALSKLTWAIGIAFVATSLTLTVLAARDAGGGSVVDRLGAPASEPATESPVLPAPGLEGDLVPETPPAATPAPEATQPSPPAPTPAPQSEGPAAPPPVQ
jgi:preprotein translocase subunit SecG